MSILDVFKETPRGIKIPVFLTAEKFQMFYLSFIKTGTSKFLVLSFIAGKVYGIIHLVRLQNFPQNENFLPPDTLTYVCLSGRKNFFLNIL